LAAAAADVLAASANVNRYFYQFHVAETSGNNRTWNVSRGADAAATRIAASKALGANGTDNEMFQGLLVAAGTAVQGFASAATSVTLTMVYDEEAV
jgi:hypothetical protein